MMSSEVRQPASLHLLLALTSSMSLRWSLCPQPTLGHQGNLSSCQLDDPQLPTEILTYGHPNLAVGILAALGSTALGPAEKAEAASRGRDSSAGDRCCWLRSVSKNRAPASRSVARWSG